MLINISKINLNPNSGGEKPIELESKEITITENGAYTVKPSEGFGGMSSVDIDVYIANPAEEIDFSEIGYTTTDNQNANIILQNEIDFAKQIQQEYTDTKLFGYTYALPFFPYIDISNRTSCQDLFSCNSSDYSIKYIPPLTISNKCTNMKSMFGYRKGLLFIDATNWDTSNVSDMSSLFFGIENLDVIGIENLDVSKLTTADDMNISCPRHLDLRNWNTSSITNMTNMFANGIKSVDVTGWDVSGVTGNYRSFGSMFYNCSSLTNIVGLDTWNISNANYLGSMFKGCSNLKNLDDIKNWNTSNVNDISGMFSESGIISLDLSNWDISNVTSWGGTTNGMFANAKSLTDVNISNWVINNEYFRSSFSGCTALKTVNMTNMVINNGNAFNELFAYRTTLTNVIGLNTITFGASLKNLRNMFYNCTLLTSLDLSGWNTSELTNITQLFYNCTLLADINMSGWNLQNITENNSTFYNCTALTNFQAPSNINTNINFSYSKNLTVDSLMSIINNLTDRTSITSKTCTLGSTNLAKLTDEQKAIATSKNWVLS